MNDPKLLAELKALLEQANARGETALAERLAETIGRIEAGTNAPAMPSLASLPVHERQLVEKWAEARDVLASIDRSMLPEMNRPGILNNLAYSTAQAGDPARGIELIVRAQAEVDAIGVDYPREKLPFFRATHGVSLSLAGKHEEAIALLAPLLEIEAPARARTVRAFYLGQSYRALGRDAEAVRALEVAIAGEGPFVPRAEAALEELRAALPP